VDSTGIGSKIVKLIVKAPSVKPDFVHLTMKLYVPGSALSDHDNLPAEIVSQVGAFVVPSSNAHTPPELVMLLPVLVMAEYSVEPAAFATPSGDVDP
jgi:hypothetical protein